MFECVAIVGVGLMGGSLGLAFRERELARRIVGLDRDEEILRQALDRRAVDAICTSLSELREADCVVFATPVGVTPVLIEAAAAFVRPGTLVTDLGSTKERIVEAGERVFGSQFVGGHPMAGSEESGVGAARADLFEGAAWCVVQSNAVAGAGGKYVKRLEAMIRPLGARPVRVAPAEHDHIVALVSHLPHVLAFAFAHTVRGEAEEERVRSLAAGSFRDQIRVAASDPALWGGILADNRDALIAVLDDYQAQLNTLRAALEQGESSTVEQALRGRGEAGKE